MSAGHTEHDVRFRGLEGSLVCHRFGDVLVDPGPASAIDALLETLPDGFSPRAIAATHVHLDHFGACGVLAQRFPDAEVWVSEHGARHLIDPSKLVASATRLYGDAMDELWGPIVPVPAERVRAVADGDVVDGFRVAYTPGHASHHVAYLHEATGIAATGDVAGVRVGGERFRGPGLASSSLPRRVHAPTPPPDIDVELWLDSIEVVREWRPEGVALTHGGLWTDVDEHLDALAEDLLTLARKADELDRDGFEAWISEQIGDDPATAAAMPPAHLYGGLARYWDKRRTGGLPPHPLRS